MAQIVFLALLGSFFTPLAVDASTQIWSGTITSGSWGNALGNGNATGYGYSSYHNAGSISQQTFTYRGTTYTIHAIAIARIGNSQPYNVTLRISPHFSPCDQQRLRLNGLSLSDAGLGGWFDGTPRYDWRGNIAWGWPVGHQIDWQLILDPTTPDAPIVTAFNEESQVQLFWTTPCDGGIDITGHEYREKVGNGAFGSWKPIPDSAAGEVNATSYTVTSLNDPSEYTFEIQAVNALGEGEISAEAVVSNRPAVPLSDRTPQVRDAIVDAVPGISDYRNVTEAHLAAITRLLLGFQNITALKPGDFSGLTALTSLNLPWNQLSSLPDSLFEGLTALTQLRLGGNSVDPLPLTVSLEKVGTDQFKAVAPSGAPFDMVLPITVANGSISGGATTITIPAGSLESQPLTVTRTPGTTFAVIVNIGTLPRLPNGHFGYALVKAADLPLEMFSRLAGSITSVCDRTPQVQTAILGVLQLQTPSPSTCGEVTEAHLATEITSLNLHGQGITALKVGDFDGLTSLTELFLHNNQLNGSIPPELGNLDNLQELRLDNNQLSGPIPPELGNLDNLQELRLRNNQLSGAIPPELGNLDNLQTLSLSNNQLSGAIPPELGNLDNLQTLSLSNNQLSGAIPPELGNLDNLQELYLHNNQLSGAIPPELGNLDNLQELYLHNNQLSGAIPPELGNLDNLQTLSLSNNQLSGAIPPELGNLDNLQELYLHNNQLSGAIPPELGNLDNLQELYLHNNQLSGCIPEGLRNVWVNGSSQRSLSFCDEGDRATLVALYQATNGDNWINNTNWLSNTPIGQWSGVTTDQAGRVTYLGLDFNQLSGAIPPELENLDNLQGLSLHFNQLSGPIPPELGNLANLQYLILGSNQLSGAIPPELGNLNNLQSLGLSNNQLSGPIPPELGNLNNLQYLRLSNNQLSGAIPPELGNLDNLQRLSLSNNQLSGCIPEGLRNVWVNGSSQRSLSFCDEGDRATLVALYQATNGDNWTNNTNWLSNTPIGQWYGVRTDQAGRVTRLWLGSNQLSGPIPPELGNLNNLQELRLSNNQLSGPIPPELGNLANLQYLILGSNQLSGPIPPELGNLNNLQSLGLSSNQLSGPIPPELGNLNNLQYLWLSNNQLSGAIPPELGNLDNLLSLSLSNNQLSGPIPAELSNLANLRRLFLDSNPGLSGPLPGSFTGLSALGILVLGDTQLCAPTDAAFQAWLSRIGDKSGVVNCGLGDAAVSASPDSLALVALYQATNGDNWTNNANWLSDEPIGEWHGVTTDANGRVTELNLTQNQLSGTIPLELGNLANLTIMGLTDNQLSGTIPSELGNLANLTELFLNSNQLSGVIPPELGTLSNLRWLALSQNRLSGSILSALGNLSNLTRLDLRENELSGVIPPELGNLANLTMLGLSDNQLSGTIPPQLGSLSNLKWLLLSQNELSGAIPASLGNLANLQFLHLSDNQLSGAIPPQLGNLSNLTQLGLADNQLSGPIPAELANLANLRDLSLGSNQLSGAIPAELANLANLQSLHLYSNQLSGAIPAELANLANLRELWLGDTQLCVPTDAAFQAWLSGIGSKSGVVNCGLGDAAVSASPDSLALVVLYNATDGANWTNNANWLSDKPIGEWHGVTTDEAGRVTYLTLLGNNLVGTLPAELENLSNLLSLLLSGNQLSGTIPPQLGSLSNLKWLLLRENELSGAIPASLGNLANLQILDLSSNQLSGAIPAELANLSNLMQLGLADNQLSGAIPASLGNLANLQILDLSSNQLSGAIPAELANLVNLQRLGLSGNQLSGCIPDGLGAVSSNDFAQLGLLFCGAAVSPPTVEITRLVSTPASLPEDAGATTITLTATLAAASATADTIRFALVAPTTGPEAIRDTDYTATLGAVVPLAAGATEATTTLTLTPIDNNEADGDRFLGVQASIAGSSAQTDIKISDDEGPSTKITLTTNPTEIREDAGATEVRVTAALDGNVLGEDVTLTLVLAPAGTATRDSDYTAVLGRLVIVADRIQGSTAVSITPVDDGEAEPDETIIVQVTSNPTNQDGDPLAVGTATITLKDTGEHVEPPPPSDTTPAFAGTVADLSATVGAPIVPVALPAATGNDPMTYAVSTLPAGLSFDPATRTLSGTPTAAGTTTVTYTVTDDTGTSSTKSFTITIAEPPPPTVEITRLVSTPASLPEDAGATTITLTATLAAASATADTIRFALVAPTTGPEAIRDTDYAATLGATVPLAAGATEATTTLTLTPIDNNEADGDRFLGVQASIAGSSAQTDIKISDAEGPSTKITLTTNPAEIREDAGATEVRVTAALDGNVLAEDVTLQLVLASNATATRDLDYTAILGRLTIPAGKEQGMTTISITPTDDGVADGAEQIILTSETALTNEEGDPIAIEAATITLKDTGEHVEPPPPSDTTPTFAGTVADLSATVGAPIAPIALPVATGNDPMTYAVSTLPAGLSFDPATRTLSGTPTAAGTTTVTYTVIDGDAESPESAAQTFTIAVAEAPASTVEIAGLVATPASLREDAGATTITLTATLTAASATAATIRFALVAPTTGPAAIRDTDYTATLAAVVPLAAGATEATTTLTLTPIDNNEADGERSLGMQASIAGSSAQIDIKISDDETPSTSIALSVNPAEISEQDGLVNVEVTAALDGAPLSENAIVTLSIDPASTASRDIDYSVVFAPQIQIPSGSTMGSTQLEIQPVADSEAEGDETIKLIGVINGLMGDEAEITLSDQAVPPEETDDSPLTFADDTAIADQEYTAGTPIDPLVLPEASGGTGQLTYSVSTLPAGLVFDPATRTISGTPTAATDGAVTVAYTATDEAGTAVVLTFSITVNPGLSFGDLFD